MLSPIAIPGGLSGLLAQAGGYDCLPSCVALLKPEGQICYANPAAWRLEQHLHQDPNGGAGMLSVPAVATLLATASETQAPQELRQTFYYSRHIPVELTLSVCPVIDLESGAVDGALLTIGEEQIDFDRRHLARVQAEKKELTDRVRRLDRARIENESMMRILLAEMPIALIVFDSDRRVVQLNRAAEVLFDTPRRKAVGMHCSQYLDCHEKSGRTCPVLEHKARISLEEITPLTRADNPHLLRTAVALREGEQPVVLEAFIDISKRKAAEEQLARYRMELENIVAERTARLERSVSELESFSYSVSHDLRSPLRAIDGFSQALLDDYRDSLDEAAVDYITRSRKAAQRMGRLIDDLLELSQISRRIIQRRPVDISAVAREVAEELQEAHPGRRVNISIEPELRAAAEPGLIHALFSNLIGNAWKFTSSHSDARIEIGSTVIDDEDVFYVRDNGVGFSMEHADKLFQPFQVLDACSPQSGNGIGLATVQRIIHRHDGCIWARSAPGEGTVFYFTLQP